jgi:hypothetical protein
MTQFTWVGVSSDLANSFNWAPQPQPPAPPVIPGPGDSAKFQKVGTPTFFPVTGSLSVSVGEIVNSEFDLLGSLTATSFTVDGPGLLVLTSSGTDGSSLTTSSENVNGTLTQETGTNIAQQLNVNGTYNLQNGTLAVSGFQLIGNNLPSLVTGKFIQTGGISSAAGMELIDGLVDLKGGTYTISNNGFAFVGIGGPAAFVVETGATATFQGGLVVGFNTAGDFNTAQFQQTGGVLNFGAMYVGDGGFGTALISGGIWNQSGSGTIFVGFNNFASSPGNAGNGKLVIGGQVPLQFTASAISIATNDTGIAGPLTTAQGEFDLGFGGSIVTLTLNSATTGLEVGDFGTGTFNENVGSKLTVTNNVIVGNQGGATGTVNQNGIFTVGGSLIIGRQDGATGTLNLSGASSKLQTMNLFIGSADGSHGTLNMTGGTLTVTDPLNAVVGFDGTGTYNETGGAANFAGQVTIGDSPTGIGTFTLGGTGDVTFGGAVQLGNDAGAQGIFNFNTTIGDSATMEGPTVNGPSFQVGIDGTGTLNAGGGALNANDIAIGKHDGSKGTMSVSGNGANATALTIEVGNVTLVDLSGNFKGGRGTLTIDQHAAVSVKGTVKLDDVARADANGTIFFMPDDGKVDIRNGGSLEVGGLGRAPSDELQIVPQGLLQGFGLIDSALVGQAYVQRLKFDQDGRSPTKSPIYSLTLDIESGGTLEAKDGPLVVHGNVQGSGTAQIDSKSTLEIGGFVDKATTIKFADSDPSSGTATLILDRPADFEGSLSNIAVGDMIVLRNTNHTNWNEVLSATIGKDKNGTQLLQIEEGEYHRTFLQGGSDDRTMNTISVKITGAADLTHDYFKVSKSANGNDTILTLASGDPIDTAVNGPQARQLGFTGKGIKVGIISNSFNAKGGMEADVAAGKLPNGVEVLGPSYSGDDEGRAMAQIVHAIAPNATIAFYSGFGAPLETAINALVADGCQVIVDDLASFQKNSETGVFGIEDGNSPANLAIDAAVQAGVTYVTSGGNYRSSGPDILGHSKLPIVGHNANPLALTAASINWLATPIGNAYLQSLTDSFSSHGGTLGKPNLTAPDGGPTTLPLDDREPLSPFFGTSAAAPAAAAVAALMLQANPQLQSNPLLLDSLMMQTATPMAEDFSTAGAGLVNALVAVAQAQATRQLFYVANGGHSFAGVNIAQPASVLSAELSHPSGSVATAAVVYITVSFDAPIIVSGLPSLSLNVGSTAAYDGALSLPTRVVFDYTVGAGEHTPSLTINNLNLNGGSLLDGNGLAPDLTVLFGMPTGLTINTPLHIASVSTLQSGEVPLSGTVQLVLTMNEAVSLDLAGGSPVLTLGNGAAATYDSAASQLGAGKLVFDYAPAPGDNSANLLAVWVSLPSGTTVQDIDGNNADFSTIATFSTGLQVGPVTVVLLQSGSGLTVQSGEVAELILNLSQGVTVDGGGAASIMTLSNGGSATYDAAKSDPAEGVLIFDYLVGPGGQAPSIGVTGFSLNGTSIHDSHGIAVDFLALPDLEANLSVNSPLVVTSVAASPTGTAAAGALVHVTVSMNEALVVEGVDIGGPGLTLSLNDGGTAAYDAAASEVSSGILVFDYTVGAADATANLAVKDVAFGGMVVTDDNGFNADFSGAFNVPLGLAIDRVPVVSSIATSGTGITNGTGQLNVGKLVTLTVTMSEAVTVVGTPLLTLNDGGTASYTSGFGTNTLAFQYSVQAGENTSDLTVSALDLHGGSIVDSAGNAANLTGATNYNPAGILLIDTTPVTPPAASGDAYVTEGGHGVTATLSDGVLFNDTGTSLASSLVTGPVHGSLQLHSDGSFNYTPVTGFTGIDSFTYAATNGSGTSDAQALLYVVPVNVGTTTTLSLLTLNAEEQIAATYTAFFSRGADKAGFEFWVDLFHQYLPSLGPVSLFQNIASSFGVSDEAKGIYPFLANPAGASDAQIGSFLDTVYHNMFNRGGDAPGLAYWTGQIKQTIAAGRFVGDALVNIIGGAQNNAEGQDITTLMGKVAVGLEYVHQQQQLGTTWSFAVDGASSTALLHAVTADPQTVLVGIKQADALIHADVH